MGELWEIEYVPIIPCSFNKRRWDYAGLGVVDSKARIISIADAHRDDGRCFVVRADEKLTAFLELECATRTYDDCA